MTSYIISSLAFFLFSVFFYLWWKNYNFSRRLAKEMSAFKDEDFTEELEHDSILKILNKANKKLELTSKYLMQLGNLREDEMDPVISKDSIGQSLISMQKEMKQLKEEEDNRNWITEGLANFGEILRNKVELNNYCSSIIRNLVKYVDGNQGGVYILSEDANGKYLELKSCYAYEKERYNTLKVYEGDGILGQCIYDKEFVMLTDIPQGYTKITSGLGLATPTCLVILPLISNDKFYGAIELALFFTLKKHQIEFLKKVSINIASEIGSIITLDHTRNLLSESDKLSKRLKSSEDEMRETINQLAVTQEEISKQKEKIERKQAELNSYLQAIENTVASVEFNTDKFVINANDIFLTITGYSIKDIQNCSYLKFMKDDDSMNLMWQNILEGKFFSGEFKIKGSDGKELWLNGTFNPILDFGGNPKKVMMCAQFITQEKEKLHELNVIINSFKATIPMVEFNSTFQCKSANEKFLSIFGLTRLSLKNAKLEDIIVSHDFIKRFQEQCTSCPDKTAFEYTEDFRIKDQFKKYLISISALRNLQGEIHRIAIMFIHPIS